LKLLLGPKLPLSEMHPQLTMRRNPVRDTYDEGKSAWVRRMNISEISEAAQTRLVRKEAVSDAAAGETRIWVRRAAISGPSRTRTGAVSGPSEMRSSSANSPILKIAAPKSNSRLAVQHVIPKLQRNAKRSAKVSAADARKTKEWRLRLRL
jgi:hypothetical protein